MRVAARDANWLPGSVEGGYLVRRLKDILNRPRLIIVGLSDKRPSTGWVCVDGDPRNPSVMVTRIGDQCVIVGETRREVGGKYVDLDELARVIAWEVELMNASESK